MELNKMKSRLEAKVGTILPQVKIKNKINREGFIIAFYLLDKDKRAISTATESAKKTASSKISTTEKKQANENVLQSSKAITHHHNNTA